jgi:hypothetical protein
MSNIFAQYLQPPRSVADYSADLDRRDLLNLQLQGAQGQNELLKLTREQQMEASRQANEKQNVMRRILSDPTLVTPQAKEQALMSHPLTMQEGLAAQQQRLTNEKTAAGTAETQAKTLEEQRKTSEAKRQAAVQHMAAFGSADEALASVQSAPDIPPEHKQAIVQSLQATGGDPLKFREWQLRTILSLASPEKQAAGMAPNIQTRNTGATTDTLAVDPLTGMPRVTGSVKNTQSPDSVASNATSRANNAATINKDFLLAGLNPDGTRPGVTTGPDGKIDLSSIAPEDLAAAYRYKADGTLPPNMGRGAQGAAESRRIRSIASAIDAQTGESPEDARIRQLALKGDVGAINQMRKREVAIGANVKNFDFNADQVLSLSNKVDRTGIPVINAWINAGRRSVTGNPELSAFDTAIKTTVNEFAQIVGGTTAGATTEGEKKKAEALLNAQQTPEQIIATIQQMRIESQNRMKSFADQRKQSMPTNTTKAPEPTASPAGLPSMSEIDAEIERRKGKK